MTTIHCLSPNTLKNWLETQPQAVRSWVDSVGFKAKEHTLCLIPEGVGLLSSVLCGLGDKTDLWSLAHLPNLLPKGEYTIAPLPVSADATQFALGMQLATYQFTAHKSHVAPRHLPRFQWSDPVDENRVEILSRAIFHGRDLVNEPANILGPTALAEAAGVVAERFGARIKVIVGEDLLTQNYPTIYTVGKAAADAPRLVDFIWGDETHPKITLVGKGVTFDSGGLNIKSGSNMKLMKKDMGGAAAVLSLAEMIMALKLPVRLRVLIAAVENSIAGNAMRPLDIVTTRKGITVEITDTDAEGRLILCDALAEADSESPEMIVDCATLTGASRIALGAEMPSFFTDDEKLAAEINEQSVAEHDPLWRLPLWEGYRDMLHSNTADMVNTSDSSYGGAIVAALFLKSFVKTKGWVHIDMMAWNLGKRPGRPSGGEVMAARALLALLEKRYA